jgi:uncharacterized membrane protein
MAGMETSIQINRPVETVYGFFLDLERNIVATDPKVESVVKTSEGPPGPGTTYLIRQPVMGRIREQRMAITAVDPNRRIDMEARFGPVAPKFSLAFEPTGAGTRVTYRGESRPVGAFKIVSPLMDRVGQRNWVRRLQMIKAVLETDALSVGGRDRE